MSPIRVAILECDSLIPWIATKYGGYWGLYTSLLEAGAKDLKLPKDELETTKWDVVNRREYPNLEDIDAILLSGSSTYTSCGRSQGLMGQKVPGKCFGYGRG